MVYEERTIVQKHIWVLKLAHVKDNSDHYQIVAIFPSRETLISWLEEQKAPQPYKTEPEKDSFGRVHPYNLVFKEGSPIQWFNPPDNLSTSFLETWVTDETLRSYESLMH